MSELATMTPEATAAPLANRHTIATIDFDLLRKSKLNVRRHGARDVASLAKLIRSQGLLQPLIVLRHADHAEVIAGGRRFDALALIAKEDGAAPAPVPCVVLDDASEAAAIEASLTENIARLAMDELDEYTAFAALLKQGRSEAEIAAAFHVTTVTVRRRLALARLHPEIHKAYRAGELDGDTIKLLTLASREKQREYATLLRDEHAQLPARWKLKEWIFGGAAIKTSAALFDRASYKGAISGDLFGDAEFFADSDEFWTLQNEAIAAIAADYTAKGWTVQTFGPGERYDAHLWDPLPKSQGGKLIIDVRSDGTIETHKGRATRADVKQAARRRENSIPGDGDTQGDTTTNRAELTGSLTTYLDLIRATAVRADLIKKPKLALRMLLAQLVAGAVYVSAKPDPMRAECEDTAQAIAAMPGRAALDTATRALVIKLGLGDDATLFTSWDRDRPKLFAAIMALTDAEVTHALAVVVAHTLATGSTLIDIAGEHLATDCRTQWAPDEPFFKMLRDQEVLTALVQDVSGETAANATKGQPTKVKRAAIREGLTSNPKWLPAWLAFPRRQYTTRTLTTNPTSAA